MYSETDLEQLRLSLNERALRFAREECSEGMCPIEAELVCCVEDSIRIVSEGASIATHIPVLAMRRIRACISAGTCDLAQV